MKLSALVLLMVICVSWVFAVDLINQDEKKYKVVVTEDNVTRNESVSAGGNIINLCQNGEIKVVGAGTVNASGDQKVVINGGKLTVKDY